MILYLIFRATIWLISIIVILGTYNNINSFSATLFVFAICVLCDYALLFSRGIINVSSNNIKRKSSSYHLGNMIYSIVQLVFSSLGLLSILFVTVVSILGLSNIIYLRDNVFYFKNSGILKEWTVNMSSIRDILIFICAAQGFEINFTLDRDKDFTIKRMSEQN